MQVTKCDRCGKVFSPIEDAIKNCDPRKKYWRYDIYFDAHPYPQEKYDLCDDCKKDLYNWIIGAGKYEKK